MSGNGEQLPPGWTAPALGEIAQVNPPLDRCVTNDSGEVTFVPMRAVDAEGGGLLWPEKRPYGEVKKGYTSFLSGDVIMAKITPCMENGKTTVVPELTGQICFGSTEFHVIRPEKGVQPRWIAQYLLQYEIRRAAQRQMTGGVGQMRVPASFLETVRIPLAPAADQERIADSLDELFSDLDAGAAALQRVREKLKLYRASVLKAAVEGALTAEWRAQHPHVEPASKLLERVLAERRRRWEEEQLAKFKTKTQEPPKNWKAKYKEPVAPEVGNSPWLPEGWCSVMLDQVLWKLRSGTGETSRREPTNYPVLKSSAVRYGAIDFEDLNYLYGSQSLRSANFLQRGDFLITRLSGSLNYVGCGAFVTDVACEGIQYPDRIFCGKLLKAIDGTYLSYCFQHSGIRKSLEEAAKSTAGHQRISMSDLVTLTLPLPSLAEQQAIVESVEDQISIIDHLEADVDANLKNAQSLRQAILRHAFTGQLVPQDPNDEPASELLKRIAAKREQRARETAITKGKPKRVTRTKRL